MDRERALTIFQTMNEIRQFEDKAYRLFEENKLRGSVHLYTGEEAIAATVCSSLGDDDYITSTHRGHGHCIAKGADLGKAMAELMGKETGYCKGRSGSMHIADFTKGNLGANAIVGGSIPIAVGAALGVKMQSRKNVVVSFFGDAASNAGTFHEGLNMAAVMKLPCIFICENNGFGITVAQKVSTSVEDISQRSVGYNMAGVTVDGNDVLAIDKAFLEAKEPALSGQGPTLIECKTYRLRGHWTGDPEVYRTRQEVEAWRQKDCIPRFRQYLVENSLATVGELETIEKEARLKVDKATEFAMNSPEPDPSTVMRDVFYEASTESERGQWS